MSDLSENEMHFKNVYEGMPVETDGDDDDDDVKSDEDVDDTDSESADEKYKVIPNLAADEIRGLRFCSWFDALKFYASYAKSLGFVVRKDEVRRDAQKNIVLRQYVCNKEGLRELKYFTMDRKRSHRPLSRTNCQAKLRVRLDYRTSEWYVVSFVEKHNHELTPSKYSHVIPAYRTLSESDKAQVDSMHLAGIRTCHIMGFMMEQKGGYSRLGFLKEDLYNYIHKQKHYRIRGGDARAAISYLRGKADNDSMFYSKYTTTDDNKLKNVFWADGCSRADFQCFGDVLSFDATYGKTRYNHPLVIFSGSNHHSQTIIFGCALLVDETKESYKWLLETFLEAMSNKHPKSVVTDGDKAMRVAIKQVFPGASHRLCTWHLFKNAKDNVKNKSFLTGFGTAMNSDFTVDKFEEFWKNLVDEHGLVGNKWVVETHGRRRSWATAYLRDQFFAGIRTTSRCEAINCRIKPYVGKKNSIVEFMHNIEQAIRVYRQNELKADYNSLFTDNVLTTTLYKLESDASKVYTHEIFREVKSQIEAVGGLDIMEKKVNGEIKIFKMNRYRKRNIALNVLYDTSKNEFLCDCRLFESRGIPCSHIFVVMRNEDMESIPNTLICRRWRKDAKAEFMSSPSSDEVALEVMRTARYSVVAASCNNLCRVASENGEFLSELMEDIVKLTSKYQKKVRVQTGGRGGVNDIQDPDVITGKGAPPKKRYKRKRGRCSNCHRIGHTIKTCTAFNGAKEDHAMDVTQSEREGESVKEKENEFSERDDKSVQQTPDTTQPSISKNANAKKPRCPAKAKKPRCPAKAKKQKVNSLTVKSEKEMEKKLNASVSSQHPEFIDEGCVLSTQNSAKQTKTKHDSSTSILHGGTTPVGNHMPNQPNFPHGVGTWMAPHNIGYGYGTPSHGMNMHPFYGFVPFMRQIPQVTIPPHTGGGHSNLLRQVMNNANETSGKSGQPTQLR